MAKEKTPRKKLLKEPDEFISTTAKVIQFIRRNTKWVVLGVFVVLLGAGALWAWSQSRAHREAQGQESFALAYQLYRSAMEQQEESSSKELLQKAEARFQELIEEYTGTRAAWMASLYRGHALFELGRYSEAVHDYEDALQNAPTEDMRLVVLQRLGYSFLANGEISKAIEVFQTLQRESPEGMKRFAKWSLALCYERKGDRKKALDLYKELQGTLPDGFERLLARIKVSELTKGEKTSEAQ